MARRILFINILLLSVLAFGAYQFISSWESFQSQNNLKTILAQATRGAEQGVPSADLAEQEELEHDFFVISERDLFSPERRSAAVDEEAETEEEAPQFPKRPEMNGMQIVSGESRALLTVFDSPKDATGEARVVRVGDIVQGYVVTEMTDTTVTLTWNDQDELIDMLDSTPTANAGPAAPKVAALNIIRIGSRHAAVETSSPETAAQEGESRGLQVAVVGGQAAAQGRRGGLAGGGVAGQRGVGAMGSRTGGLGNRGGMPSNLGLGGRSRGLTGQPRTMPRN
jgi:hypothetical protein